MWRQHRWETAYLFSGHKIKQNKKQNKNKIKSQSVDVQFVVKIMQTVEWPTGPFSETSDKSEQSSHMTTSEWADFLPE